MNGILFIFLICAFLFLNWKLLQRYASQGSAAQISSNMIHLVAVSSTATSISITLKWLVRNNLHQLRDTDQQHHSLYIDLEQQLEDSAISNYKESLEASECQECEVIETNNKNRTVLFWNINYRPIRSQYSHANYFSPYFNNLHG